MNPWPFVIAAYAATVVITTWLLLSSFLGMKRSEAAADKLARK